MWGAVPIPCRDRRFTWLCYYQLTCQPRLPSYIYAVFDHTLSFLSLYLSTSFVCYFKRRQHVSRATKPNGVVDRGATTSSGAETGLLARPTRGGPVRVFGQHLPVDNGRGNIQAHGGAAAVQGQDWRH